MNNTAIVGCACLMSVGLMAACIPAIMAPSNDYIASELQLVTTTTTDCTTTTTEVVTTSDLSEEVTTTEILIDSIPEGAEQNEEDQEENS